jgi:hypothetical protein
MNPGRIMEGKNMRQINYYTLLNLDGSANLTAIKTIGAIDEK